MQRFKKALNINRRTVYSISVLLVNGNCWHLVERSISLCKIIRTDLRLTRHNQRNQTWLFQSKTWLGRRRCGEPSIQCCLQSALVGDSDSNEQGGWYGQKDGANKSGRRDESWLSKNCGFFYFSSKSGKILRKLDLTESKESLYLLYQNVTSLYFIEKMSSLKWKWSVYR